MAGYMYDYNMFIVYAHCQLYPTIIHNVELPTIIQLLYIYILMLIPWSSDLPNDIPSALWPAHLPAAPFSPFSARCGGRKTPDVAAQVRSLGGMPGYTEQIWWFSYTSYGGTPKSSIDIWDFAPSSYWGSSILGNLYIMVFLSHGHPQVTRGFNTNAV